MPRRAARSSAGNRPGYRCRRGGRTGSSGAMRSQRSSGTRSADTRQILPTQHPTAKPPHRSHSETISYTPGGRAFNTRPSLCIPKRLGSCCAPALPWPLGDVFASCRCASPDHSMSKWASSPPSRSIRRSSPAVPVPFSPVALFTRLGSGSKLSVKHAPCVTVEGRSCRPPERVLRLKEPLFPSIVAGFGQRCAGVVSASRCPQCAQRSRPSHTDQPKSAGVRAWPSNSLRTASR